MKLAPDDVKYETATKERKRSLVIHDVQAEDAGKYVCEVGEHRTTAAVQVLKPTEKGSRNCGNFATFQNYPLTRLEMFCDVAQH